MGILKKLVLVIYLCLQVVSFQAIAQTESESTQAISDLRVQIIRLEEQNKILITSNNDIRSSYYWALGFSATFLILFLGVNIYFFRNRFDEDKEFLLNSIKDKFNLIEKNNQQVIASEMAVFDAKLEMTFKTKSEQLTKYYDSSVSSNSTAIQRLLIEVTELKLKNVISDGCKPNILTGYLALAKETLKLGSSYDWKTSECLSKAKELMDEGVKIEPMELPELITFINSLPEQFSGVSEEIRKYCR
ncbi:hypothetical protein ACP5PY_00340 [Photobacterium leiognathi subsp. mandapamensis]